MKTLTRITSWMLLAIGLFLLTGCHRLAVPSDARSSRIALKSYHGRYVTALGEGGDWLFKQSDELGDCGRFTRYDLANGRIALQTCNGRFLTAPGRGSARLDWRVWQESGLGDCGQFVPVTQDSGIALKTCAGRYLTAGDGYWDPPLQWSVVAATDKLQAWEIFEMLPQR